MSSISTLLTRNLQTSSVKTTPRVGGPPSTRSTPKMECSTILPAEHTVAATRSIASRPRSGQLTLTFGISQLPSPRNWATAGGSSGYRAALVRRPLTPGLISSLSGTAGLPPFISFSTSYPELPPRPRRRLPNQRRGPGLENRLTIVAVVTRSSLRSLIAKKPANLSNEASTTIDR